MFGWIIVGIILFLIEEAIRHDVNVWDILRETKAGKLSSRRVGMMVCLWILAEIGIDLIKADVIDKLDLAVLGIFGLLAFSPQLFGMLINKLIDVFGKKSE